MKNIATYPVFTGLLEKNPVEVNAQKVRPMQVTEKFLPEILFITSYPPRECGIATYSQDLIKALNNKFIHSFSIKVCALESGSPGYEYPEEVLYTLDTDDSKQYYELAKTINADQNLHQVVIQHEFGFFNQQREKDFLQFLFMLTKPAVLVFHTVLPHPDILWRAKVRHIVAACDAIIVMTHNAEQILMEDYGITPDKITVIPHGTHLVPHLDKEILKEKHGLAGKKVLATFGLLSSGKGIETTLEALPAIVELNPDVIFLVLGKTHPGVVKCEGEKYRDMLEEKVDALDLRQQVKFINRYLPLEDLLEYLQLTDIYLFTSKDPNQAVSGTFSYALSCGCPIVSTPIPHAKEVLRGDTGIIIDFQNAGQLASEVNRLMQDDGLRLHFSSNTLQEMAPTAWENSANSHALLLQEISQNHSLQSRKINLQYRLPALNLAHIKKMTTDFGMIQFSKINLPDIESGYTLDDNARALIAICMHYELTGDISDLFYIDKYLKVIQFCQQKEGHFLNYVDIDLQFTDQNEATNLADSNGRAIWALGYLLSLSDSMPLPVVEIASSVFLRSLPRIQAIHSTRAMAFALKGLYFYNVDKKSTAIQLLIKTLANRLVQMYRHESENGWKWFESYLTYGNSLLPEALLYAYIATGDELYKVTAKASFDFLLSLTFNEKGIKVISNKTWLQKGQEAAEHGEQPIDVAYTIMALSLFHQIFQKETYAKKMFTAFNWFLGNNHLHQIIYNPCTGGCYDGLEETQVNLNQGAESTVSYLMSRLTVEKFS